MKIELKNLPKSEVELTINLSPEEMANYIDTACRELSRQTNIKGFRPGAAPNDMVIRELGQDKINQAAFNIAVKENYQKAVTDKHLEPINDPKIIIEKQDEGLTFKAVVAVLPKVELGDYKKIKVPAETIKIEEKEISNVLEDIKKTRAQNTTVSRPAQTGDRVEIDFKVKRDGVIIDSGESQQHPLILGEGHFISGFEKELEGLKENEVKNFSLVAPADYHNKELAGQKLDFEVKMNLVQERKLPELTDEFVKTLGSFEKAEDLKQNVREGLKMEKEMKARDERRQKIALALVKDANADLPDELINMEIEKMTAELSDSLARMNLTLDSYLTHLKKSFEELKKDWRPQAEQRVKVALALKEVAKRENIEVSEEEIEAKLAQLLRSAPPMQPDQNLDLTVLRGYVRGLIRNDKVFELLENQFNS